MNTAQRQDAREYAQWRIANGHDPKGLVHIMYYPADYYAYDEKIMGLSTPLPAGSSLSGYTEQYYTLEQLAG